MSRPNAGIDVDDNIASIPYLFVPLEGHADDQDLTAPPFASEFTFSPCGTRMSRGGASTSRGGRAMSRGVVSRRCVGLRKHSTPPVSPPIAILTDDKKDKESRASSSHERLTESIQILPITTVQELFRNVQRILHRRGITNSIMLEYFELRPRDESSRDNLPLISGEKYSEVLLSAGELNALEVSTPRFQRRDMTRTLYPESPLVVWSVLLHDLSKPIEFYGVSNGGIIYVHHF